MAGTASAQRQAFAQHVVDAMRPFGRVSAKAMFGGHGLYRDGLMFALILDGQLYLKVDAQTTPLFVERGLAAFTYEARGKTHSMSYRLAPAEVFDDPAEMVRWATLGHECAVRNRAPVRPARGTLAAPGVSSTPAAGLGSSASWSDLPNLGDKSVEMLRQAGVDTPQDLSSLGAVRAYARVKAVCPRASLNLLWALEGALSGRPWQAVANEDRASLLMALEDAQKLRE